MSDPIVGQSTDPNTPAVSGENTGNGAGVKGQGSTGVWGESVKGGAEGVHGESYTGFAGVGGYNKGTENGAGVYGEGGTAGGEGVTGKSHSGFAGVGGYNDCPHGGPGVWGEGGKSGGDGVHGVSHSSYAGVSGYSDSTGAAIYGKSEHGDAGSFDGNVTVRGNINVTGDVVLSGADCAEEFDILEATDVEPGTVMVLDQAGALQPSQRAYDKRVAGVISGAGNYKPGIILDKQQASENRMPVALVGKVYCKIDACYGAVEVGDLLTTSETPGHAMRADDPAKAFGAVIGKALRPLKEGQGLIPILIALQ